MLYISENIDLRKKNFKQKIKLLKNYKNGYMHFFHKPIILAVI